jgi:hypothetical protein
VITLLVIFLICHTPNAVYSMYKLWLNNSQTSPEATNKIKNVILGKFLQLFFSIGKMTKSKEEKVSFSGCDLGAGDVVR